MRLIHTADIHLDASFASARLPAAFGNRRRQSLRETFRAILDRARDWPADAVLIAGDLFDLDRVSRDTVAFLRECFELIRPIPVFIAPGNHDPRVAASPYATEAWPANVFIFGQPQWTAHELQNVPLTVHGFAFDGPDISRNPFGELEIPSDGRVHVAVAHGSAQGHQPPEKTAYAPFEPADAAAPGLRYLALGHFHAVTPVTGDFDTAIYYSGAPEGHGFNETGPRHYLEVTMDPEGGGPPKVEAKESARAIYVTRTLDCDGFEHQQPIIDALRELAGEHAAAVIARVTMRGAVPVDVIARMPAIHDAVADRFEYLDLIDATEVPEDYEALARENTSLGAFMEQLNAAIADAPDEDQRRMLARAREVGLAAYRGRDLPTQGLEERALR